VTRVLKRIVLVALAILVVGGSSARTFFVVAELLLVLALVEYVALAKRTGSSCRAADRGGGDVDGGRVRALGLGGFPWVPIDVVLMSALVGWARCRSPAGRGAKTRSLARRPACSIRCISDCRSRDDRDPRDAEPQALFSPAAHRDGERHAQYYTGARFRNAGSSRPPSAERGSRAAIGGFIFGGVLLAIGANGGCPLCRWRFARRSRDRGRAGHLSAICSSRCSNEAPA